MKSKDLAAELEQAAAEGFEGADEAGDLLVVARALEDLGSHQAAAPKGAADRIYARLEEALTEEFGQAPAKLGIFERVTSLDTMLPRALIQRRADKLDRLIEDARAGRPVAVRGRAAAMVAAASALQPLPAVSPSPSFVEWLAVRLQTAEALEPSRPSRLATLQAAMESLKLRAAVGMAAAALVALAMLSLPGTDKPARSPATVAAPKAPVASNSPSKPLSPVTITSPAGQQAAPALIAAPSPSVRSPRPKIGGKPKPPGGGGEEGEGGERIVPAGDSARYIIYRGLGLLPGR